MGRGGALTENQGSFLFNGIAGFCCCFGPQPHIASDAISPPKVIISE
jgi:hypothetical protein